MNEAVCPVCPHHCRILNGARGRCRARENRNGKIVCANYGKITSMSLDPIEKKPLAFFHPGSMIFSVGSFGCNMACPFCQNYEISAARESDFDGLRVVSPERLCEMAVLEKSRGNIGIAFTYNEALVGYEYVRDAARLAKKAGMKTVLVTNGMAKIPVLEEILPYIDAMNVDLKGFRSDIYEALGGDLDTVKDFIKRAARESHVEITSLIVPGMNDGPDDMRRQAEWIAKIDPDAALHITRYFPRYKTQKPPTDISVMERLRDVAAQKLSRVILGNV